MNADYIDMLKCLNKAGVDYIMVGGWAVNMYGYIRVLKLPHNCTHLTR